MCSYLKQSDSEVYEIINKEEDKQQYKLSMIPSENFFSRSVREAVGSVFMHKYSEGNVGKRYYEGNYFVDELESLCIQRAKQLFSLPDDWSANVQALSGSNANLAVYLAVLNPGDTLMGMYLPDGGHLSHGWSFEPDEAKRKSQVSNSEYLGGSKKMHITSQLYKTIQYKTDPKTCQFDYDEVEKIALKYKPRLIITGGTAYPREINYQRMSMIAKKVGALYMADIAHEAGLVAAGVNKSPIGIADIITLTTHKTLRSARGAIVFAKKDLINKINKAVLPGLQGGPHNHNIAGICVGLGEALKPEFRVYAHQVVANAKFLAGELLNYGFDLVSGGTDKHLILINLANKGVYGKKCARALDYAGIIANMNTMPQDTRGPADPSALRLGTPWVTTRGMKEPEMKQIASWIDQIVRVAGNFSDLDFKDFEQEVKNSKEIEQVKAEVMALCRQFPLEI
jgi:glycine hydroxymethyltransferase